MDKLRDHFSYSNYFYWEGKEMSLVREWEDQIQHVCLEGSVSAIDPKKNPDFVVDMTGKYDECCKKYDKASFFLFQKRDVIYGSCNECLRKAVHAKKNTMFEIEKCLD